VTPGGLLRPLLRKMIIKACARAFNGADLAEIGVYRGKSARWIADAAPNSPLYLYDTFNGMPKPGLYDWHRAGDFRDTSVGLVRRRVPRAYVIKGTFPETSFPGLNPGFVHLDGDLYQTAKDALDLWPGAVFLVDDYGTTTCPGVKKAVDETGRTVIAFPTEQALVLADALEDAK
jgi:O-methyltransferase